MVRLIEPHTTLLSCRAAATLASHVDESKTDHFRHHLYPANTTSNLNHACSFGGLMALWGTIVMTGLVGVVTFLHPTYHVAPLHCSFVTVGSAIILRLQHRFPISVVYLSMPTYRSSLRCPNMAVESAPRTQFPHPCAPLYCSNVTEGSAPRPSSMRANSYSVRSCPSSIHCRQQQHKTCDVHR